MCAIGFRSVETEHQRRKRLSHAYRSHNRPFTMTELILKNCCCSLIRCSTQWWCVKSEYSHRTRRSLFAFHFFLYSKRNRQYSKYEMSYQHSYCVLPAVQCRRNVIRCVLCIILRIFWCLQLTHSHRKDISLSCPCRLRVIFVDLFR